MKTIDVKFKIDQRAIVKAQKAADKLERTIDRIIEKQKQLLK